MSKILTHRLCDKAAIAEKDILFSLYISSLTVADTDWVTQIGQIDPFLAGLPL
ncbi:hypothetical protein [Pseudomonas saxonica]|uniref:hypothetical protein n=1 Tax=Pseudomonas saxonica TaxID=2600598 RepID=UPI0013159CBF|nr:hypothetical protein [Pseudomonas saxonica]